MHFHVCITVVGLLKQLVGADLSALEFLKLIHGQGSYVDINPADLPPFRLGRIDSIYAVENVIQSLIGIGFSRNEQNPFVSLVKDNPCFIGNLFLSQRAALYRRISFAEGTIGAVVCTKIGNI